MRGKSFMMFALPLALALPACTTSTPYRPVTAGQSQTGYSDYRIERDRYRVSFAGNSMTKRDTVERYLLFRAAELTLEQGYDGFITTDRDTEKRTRTVIDQPFHSGAYGWWGPSWSYRSPRLGWRSWSPYYGDPFWDRDIDVRTIDRYEATAEIQLRKGPKASGDARYFDARDVVENLKGSIRFPE